MRKVRAGQMPPVGRKRPEATVFDAHISALENELDRTSTVFAPPPGLHRLNRTEYANVIRDVLDLEIDAAKYLPSDDSTAGFDNIAGALGVSSTLVEAYVNASQKIARLALGYPEDPASWCTAQRKTLRRTTTSKDAVWHARRDARAAVFRLMAGTRSP